MRIRIHFWNLFFLIFYVVLFVLGLEWLAQTNKLVSWVPLGDFVLMALAVHRLVRLFTYDAITHFMREWFAEEDDNVKSEGYEPLKVGFVPLTFYIVILVSQKPRGVFFRHCVRYVIHTDSIAEKMASCHFL